MSLSPADNTARAADIARATLNNHIILGTRAENTIPDFDTFATPHYVTHNLARTQNMLIRTENDTSVARHLVHNYIHSGEKSQNSFDTVYVSDNPQSYRDRAIAIKDAQKAIANLCSEMYSRKKLSNHSQAHNWDHILYGDTPIDTIEHNEYNLPPMRITRLVLVIDDTVDLIEHYGPEKAADILAPIFKHGTRTGVHLVHVMPQKNIVDSHTQGLIEDFYAALDQATPADTQYDTMITIMEPDEATWMSEKQFVSPKFTVLGA